MVTGVPVNDEKNTKITTLITNKIDCWKVASANNLDKNILYKVIIKVKNMHNNIYNL